MLLSILITISALITGVILVEWFDPKNKFTKLEKFSGSIVIGLTAFSISTLIVALLTKSLKTGILIYLILFLSLTVIKIKKTVNIVNFFKKITVKKYFTKKIITTISLFLIIGIYITYLSTIIFYGPQKEIKAVMPGWGDNALHINFIERFATAKPFNLNHPLLEGSHLSYPFLIDFLSGIFHLLGSDMIFSYRLPIMLMGLSVILLLYAIGKRILNSNKAVIFAIVLIMMGSGFGFIRLAQDIKNIYRENGISEISQIIKNPRHVYTHLDNRTGGQVRGDQATEDNIVWIVPMISFLSHQRSFIWGFGIFLLILLGLLLYGKEKAWLRYSFLAGSLPLIHGHTLISLFIILLVIFFWNLKNWKTWVLFGIATAILAAPMITFIVSNPANSLSGSFLKPWFGWMTCVHENSWFSCTPKPGTDSNVVWFWSKNFGVIFIVWAIVMLIIASSLVSKKIKKPKLQNTSIIASSMALFAVPNFFLLQPWEFDNGKVFFYWWVLAIFFVVMPVLQKLWNTNYAGKFFVIFLIIFSSIAGVVDIAGKIFGNDPSFGYADGSKDNQELALWIKNNTEPNAIFLTNPSIDPVPTFLAGRPTYIGFEGWLWSHGLDYGKQRRIAEEVSRGNIELACENRISFILLEEIKNAFKDVNETTLKENTQPISIKTSFGHEFTILKVICNS